MALGQEVILDDNAFLVSETDARGVILFANDDFCKVAEYEIDELIGKPHNIIRHEDMPKAAFKDMWDTIKSGKSWSGYVKNKTKSGKYYWVYAVISPCKTCDGKDGYISCRRKASEKEIAKAIKMYKELRLKD
jgi:aerotaxis receptor